MTRPYTQIARWSVIVVSLLASGVAEPTACRVQSAEPSVLEFLTAHRQQTWTHVPRKVLAFYYTWYGRPERHGHWVHWKDVDPARHAIASSTHFPAKGAYDSYDPAVIDYHIDLAKEAGIDGFICTWWGQGTYDDQALKIVLERARQKHFQVSVYWETAPGEGAAQVDRAVRDLMYVLQHYGSDPAFLKVDGKPVIFVYGRVMNEVAMDQWPTIITRVQQRFAKGFLLIADGLNEINARMFDGIHTYNPCGWVQKKTPAALRETSRKTFHDAVTVAKNHGKIACITVIPGYDDTKIRTPGINAERQDGKTFEVLWDEAIRADPDWVLITSWNEWHEGSEIEPSWEYGDQYIRATAQYTKRFKKSPYSAIPIAKPVNKIGAERARQLQQLFRDHPIAVLPGYTNSVVFWLADAQVPLHELSWSDVAAGNQLDVSRYPIALYAGGEHYQQTVAKPGDVDRGLIRYLEQGGLLVVVPGGPVPFYYNEKGQSVASAQRFGLPIIMGRGELDRAPTGWENPPSDLSLTFHFNTRVLGDVAKEAPFPKTGDFRWRPTSQRAVDKDDVFISLANLRDQTGRDWGDGIAFIEHRASPPVGGKILYSSMRMDDVVDRDRLGFDLFRFAADKSTR